MRRPLRALAAAAIAAGAAGAVAPAAGVADSFTPVRLTVTIAPVARLHAPLQVTVRVDADPGALDARSGSVRASVKLAGGECGGDFASTSGATLLDRVLDPQPAPGEAYSATASGSGRPPAYGVQTVCVYLRDDYKQFATDTTDYQVDVSRPCTTTAGAYDRDLAALRRARAAARRARGAAARRRAAANVARRAAAARSDRRRALRACGPGVPL